VAVVVRHSHSLLDAVEAIARYLHVHSPALSLRLELDDDLVKVVYTMTEPGLGAMAQGYELSLANGALILDLLGGTATRPASMHFAHSRVGPLSSYQEAFGCPVHFDQPWNGFLLAAEVGSRPIDAADPETRRIARAYLDSYMPPGLQVSGQVAEIIRRLLPTGACTAEAVADQLALHPRTLQRRLSEEGHTYHDLRENVRRELALDYLGSPGLALTQVAGLLGYAEQSALNRSCQRWFGQTPRQVRRSRTARSALS
jgi:AraC-like DNA-binding protein